MSVDVPNLTESWPQRQIARLAWFMSAVAGWLYIACALMITFDVIARNLLGFSTQATVELSGYALACGIGWGFAGAFIARVHVRVDMLLDKMPSGVRAWLNLAALILLAMFLAMLAYGVFKITYESWDLDAHDMSALRIPLWVPQGLFFVGILVFIVAVVLTLAEVVVRLVRRDQAGINNMMKRKTAADEAAEALEAAHIEGDGSGGKLAAQGS